MPDKDFFRYGFGRKWWRPYRMICEAASVGHEEADACVRTLARELRQDGGCPGFQEIEKVLDRTARMTATYQSAEDLDLGSVFRELRRVELQHNGNAVTKMAVEEAMSIITQRSVRRDPYSVNSLAQDLAEGTCWRVAQYNFFAPARTYLVHEKGHSLSEARLKEESIKKAMSERVFKLASSLVRNPDAKNLRAPARSTPKGSTRAMLDEVLVQ